MVIQYKEQPIRPLLFFLGFVVICLIGAPTWALLYFGAPHNLFAVKFILAPFIGLLYLIIIARTFVFNARVRRDPRALDWDATQLSLWWNGRSETIPWSQVIGVWVKRGKSPSDPCFLKIAAHKADLGVRCWSLSSSRLQLEGRPLTELASKLESVRADKTDALMKTTADDTAGNARHEQRVARVRSAVAIFTSVYFVTLVGMVIYLSSPRTTLLTPHDPLLRLSAEYAFCASVGIWLFLLGKTLVDKAWGMWRVIAMFLPKVLFVAIGLGAMMGLWAYLAANVYVTAKTFGTHSERGAILMAAEPTVSFHGHPAIRAHLINRPGEDVFFTIDEADKASMDQWFEPGAQGHAACVTVPVEWTGQSIRTTANSDTPLPKGSVTGCS